MAPPVSPWLRRRLGADRVLAVLAGVVVAPVVAVLAALIRRADGGPGLITVPRVGRGGEVFAMWKLRSMRVSQVDGSTDGLRLTRAGDDRITPIGRVVRGLHLDELPQLWNVARGEMSLLGPRPETPEFVDLDDPAWQAVLVVPPGIAGPTQLVVGDWEGAVIAEDTEGVAYRDRVLPVKLAVDRWYVQEASPGLDLEVLWTLVRDVLPGPRAVGLRVRVWASVPAVAKLSGRGARPD